MEDVSFTDASRIANLTNYHLPANCELKAFFFILDKLNLDRCQIRSYYTIHPTKGSFPGLSIVETNPYREVLRIAFEGYPDWEVFNWMKDTLDGEEFSLNVVLYRQQSKS